MTTKPGRKALSAATPVLVDVNHEALAEASQAADQFAALQSGYGQERDLLNQLLGQAQMADAIGKLTATVAVSKMAYVKESKLYQQLSGMKDRDGRGLKGTWEEFCGLLGTSAPKVNEDISNLQAFGEGALESMSAMGIGYREMRQYRRLPEDQRLALIEVAKAGDKDGFLDLAEEIIARHAKEKEALTAQVEEAQETLQAKDRVLESKAELITRLEEQTSRKFKPRKGSEAQTADEQLLLDELEAASLAAWHGLRRTFLAADSAMDSTAREAVQIKARQAVEWLCQQLVDTATELGITVDFEERLRPNWLDEEALATMEARNAIVAAKGGSQ